jgi:putative ABC transport system permease protein
MGTLLFDLKPTDPVTYLAVTGVLGGVALLAASLPALRASRIDPALAMRGE